MTPKTKTTLEFVIVNAIHVLLATPFVCLAYSCTMILSGMWPLPENAVLPSIYGSLGVLIVYIFFSSKHNKEIRRLREKIAKLEGEQE